MGRLPFMCLAAVESFIYAVVNSREIFTSGLFKSSIQILSLYREKYIIYRENSRKYKAVKEKASRLVHFFYKD